MLSTTNAREKALISIINEPTKHQIPLTSAIIKNLAEEIGGVPVKKNWITQFVAKYKKELKSIYLKNIDFNHVKSEYLLTFKYFYILVRFDFILCLEITYLKSY